MPSPSSGVNAMCRVDVGVVGGLTVGHVQLVGADARVEAGDARVGVGAGRAPCRSGLSASGVPICQPCGYRIQFPKECQFDWNSGLMRSISALHRLGLGLRGRRSGRGRCRWRTASTSPRCRSSSARRSCGWGRRRRRSGDLAVAVVVAQVLAPQPLDVERVLVAVGVGDEHEPQLGLLQQLADLAVVGAASWSTKWWRRAPVDLGADPLAGVLQRAVEHRRPATRRGRPRAPLVTLSGDDLAALAGVADHLELHQLRLSRASAYSSSRMPPGSSYERHTVNPFTD